MAGLALARVHEPLNQFWDFTQRGFVHILLLNWCGHGKNEYPGLPFQPFADVTLKDYFDGRTEHNDIL